MSTTAASNRSRPSTPPRNSSARIRRTSGSTIASTCAGSSISTRRRTSSNGCSAWIYRCGRRRTRCSSFSTFQELIRRFPNSEYVPDARQRMVYLRNRLAEYENHVADYYIRRGAYVAAVNRAKYALEHYPEAPQLEKTLQILVVAYEQLGMGDLAADARRVLRQTFGDEAATAQL